MIEDDKISGGEAFELRLLFLHELEEAYREAQEAQELLLRDPSRPEPVQRLGEFFHRIAGTAHSVGLPVLGHLTALCENLAELISKRCLDQPERTAPLFAEALSAIAAVLAGHGGTEFERPLVRDPKEFMGLAVPGIVDEGRRLSKVLVVDDDPFSARLIDGCLRAAGFMSSCCTDPEQAIGTIERELPDLLILDVLMPTIDGFELCRRARAHPALRFTPIIFVTQKTDLKERVRGLEVGANDYISKPFEPMELVARVRSHLERLSALREMAIRDGLTRCYNHKYFKTRLEQEVARAKRYRADMALAILDIDHFKKVNDTYGHPIGDLVLVHIANIMMASVRSTDIISRYGGEEFAILLVQAAAREAEVIASRICDRIKAQAFMVPEESELHAGKEVRVTVSIGVTELAEDDHLVGLLERTDQAMYAAKAAGRNRVQVLPSKLP